MRLRNIPAAKEAVENSRLVIHEPEKSKGKIRELFQNDNEVHIEIGMGKGQFIIGMARKNPNINYIGIEMYDSVLYRALQKMDALEKQGQKVDNIRFMCVDAKILPDCFEEGEIDQIYLNFSDPWPKERHAKRRLDSRQFLGLYKKFLKKGGKIEFKTDNRGLFDFGLEEIEPAGYILLEKTFDLHADERMNAGNVCTEYEEKFSSQGNPICKYIIARD